MLRLQSPLVVVTAPNSYIDLFQLSGFKVPLLIGLSPAGLCAGTFTLGFFGWFVNVNTLLTVFLQRPQDEGGYAFTPQRNALCKSHTLKE